MKESVTLQTLGKWLNGHLQYNENGWPHRTITEEEIYEFCEGKWPKYWVMLDPTLEGE